jgi:deoxyribodipyrimidine photolyase
VQSLRALQKRLNAVGTSLLLRKGPAAKVIPELARTTGADAVFWNEIAQAPQQALAGQVTAALNEIGVASRSFPGDLLAAPADIRNKENRGLRVFTPFWRRVQALGDPPLPLPAPERLCPGPDLAGDTLESWRLEPTRPDWAGGLRESWTPGELAAQQRLDEFFGGGVTGYASRRDRLDLAGTSRLSPHLRFGEISPRQVWHAAQFGRAEYPRLSADIDKFLSELGWREFWIRWLMPPPEATPPTGNNWQWVAGSGADAAPYFRVFNPTLQGEKFDPDGAYVRRWLPELAALPAGLIHQPWSATPLELESAGVDLGKTYPEPIVDHRMGRERALKAYAKVRAA